MRTTLTIDDQLAEQLKQLAHDSGLPFKRVVNHALRQGLRMAAQPQPAISSSGEQLEASAPALPS
jgi:hypothetical protein